MYVFGCMFGKHWGTCVFIPSLHSSPLHACMLHVWILKHSGKASVTEGFPVFSLLMWHCWCHAPQIEMISGRGFVLVTHTYVFSACWEGPWASVGLGTWGCGRTDSHRHWETSLLGITDVVALSNTQKGYCVMFRAYNLQKRRAVYFSNKRRWCDLNFERTDKRLAPWRSTACINDRLRTRAHRPCLILYCQFFWNHLDLPLVEKY